MEINNLHSYIEQICLLNDELSKHAPYLSYEYLFRGLIIPAGFEPPVRKLRATIPECESQCSGV